MKSDADSAGIARLNGALSGDAGGDTEKVVHRNEAPISQYFLSGPCRDRTDDIHGVNVALYQLS